MLRKQTLSDKAKDEWPRVQGVAAMRVLVQMMIDIRRRQSKQLVPGEKQLVYSPVTDLSQLKRLAARRWTLRARGAGPSQGEKGLLLIRTARPLTLDGSTAIARLLQQDTRAGGICDFCGQDCSYGGCMLVGSTDELPISLVARHFAVPLTLPRRVNDPAISA
eukprot:TRINITY_DN96801_c0_g1_i1.p1 TRINITY_DN96801_c0_g1~~TRINITY_DN96801_c0_g1_i1.p1  ORF type:complete len:163 (+),score=25.80 TRINITY_DN96801_c0_g1_i1:238-726(+)